MSNKPDPKGDPNFDFSADAGDVDPFAEDAGGGADPFDCSDDLESGGQPPPQPAASPPPPAPRAPPSPAPASAAASKAPPRSKRAKAPASKDTRSAGLAEGVAVQVVAVLGKKTITVGELVAMKKGQVVELNRFPNEAVDLVANGKLMAKGELVEIDGKLGVRIIKIFE